ncbi:hypothetical protein CQA49_08695 [Helicobacter sp. MIT 00-7814]|nr:hypothetical protein CQA49_08695 [Helicobacter sp. MIT 00-7814]RDU56774.1 hypothetical protein CQA37_01340 [Helicobacter sp. MIT 99-10781]
MKNSAFWLFLRILYKIFAHAPQVRSAQILLENHKNSSKILEFLKSGARKIAQFRQTGSTRNSSIVRKIFAKVRKMRKELPLAVVTKHFLRLLTKRLRARRIYLNLKGEL